MGELAIGAVIGDYVVENQIGTGGCGAVYAATHRPSGQKVALKALHQFLAASPKMIQRFSLEVRALNMIHHPNIVEIHAVGTLEDGAPYYVMDLVDGKSLRELVRKRGRLSPSEALGLLDPISSALEAAHQAGVVHRDLKAANVLVANAESERLVKLVDFGTVKLTTPEPGATGLTSAGRRVGTLSAMSPEQIRGENIDARADIYSLGVLAFFLLTGRNPFIATDAVELEQMHLSQPPPRPSQIGPVPQALDAVILRCLEKSRENRYASAKQFADAFREAAGLAEKSGGNPTVKALAVYFEIWPERNSTLDGEQDSDLLLDEMAEVLDEAELILTDAGYTIAMHASNVLLGVRVVDSGANLDRQVRDALAVALRAQRDSLGRARAGMVSGASCIHLDDAEVREGPGGHAPTGGAIMRIGNWAPRDRRPGVTLTKEIAAAAPSVSMQAAADHVRVLRR